MESRCVLFLVVSCILWICATCQDVPPYTEDCQHGMYPSKARSTGVPPTFKINLDLDPQIRWNEVMKHKGANVKAMIDQVKKLISDVSPQLVDLVNKYLPEIIEKLPAPYDAEILGISKATGIEDGEILLFNIFYEVFTMCTSIVAQDVGGTLYHARNLDFGLFMGWDTKNHTWLIAEYLHPLVVNLDFTRNGTTVYKTVNFAGYIGVLTGMKPGVFSLTLNERFNVNGGYIGLIEWILGYRKAHWTSFLTRDALEKSNSYEEAVDMLSNTEILAPVYYIVGGSKPGQGAIITRDRQSLTNMYSMAPDKGMWYVLETNYDNWTDPPFFDDRRTPGKKCLSGVGNKKVDFQTIYDVLSTKPVLNQLTTYTALMQVNKGTLETYIRHCPHPCWAW
uniref:Acid ceramidase n=1 Tax=Phallusia mammillata TaxID=59560 RepID=A0A6F9D7Q6_9ASCI|nr:acid ceramidase-like [Phallusia mammillata]